MELNEYEKIILEKLKELKMKISIRQLSQRIKLSYPTTLKYINTLLLKNEINVVDFGNVKYVKCNK